MQKKQVYGSFIVTMHKAKTHYAIYGHTKIGTYETEIGLVQALNAFGLDLRDYELQDQIANNSECELVNIWRYKGTAS